ncbi:hypothetical protein LTR95_001593 [Oleoguttula sp. CCFEE 5521]
MSHAKLKAVVMKYDVSSFITTSAHTSLLSTSATAVADSEKFCDELESKPSQPPRISVSRPAAGYDVIESPHESGRADAKAVDTAVAGHAGSAPRSFGSNIASNCRSKVSRAVAEWTNPSKVIQVAPALPVRQYTQLELLSLNDNPTLGQTLSSATAGPSAANMRLACPLCPRVLHTKHGLMQHLKSAVHAHADFHCLNPHSGSAEMGRTAPRFRSLGNLVQHLETRACVGWDEVLAFILGILEEPKEVNLDGKASYG